MASGERCLLLHIFVQSIRRTVRQQMYNYAVQAAFFDVRFYMPTNF